MSKDFTHIDRYLDGEMNAEDVQRFEAKIAVDPVLAEEVKLQEEMRKLYSDEEWVDTTTSLAKNAEVEEYVQFFRSEEANKLRNSIKSIIKKGKPIKNNTPRRIGIAVTILLFCGLSFLFFWNRTPNYEALYVQYLNKENITSMVSRGAEDNMLMKGQLLFEDGHYEAAITAFSEYQDQTERIHPTSYIYLGVSYLESNQYEKALNMFEKLETSNTLESNKAKWFIAMVYLKQEDKEQLILTLKDIGSNKENYNFDKANALFDAID